MDIYTKRRRARRLNDPDREAIAKWSNDEDDGPDPEDLELDYSGVVDAGEEEAQEQREKMMKSVEGNEPDLDFEEAFTGNREDPDLELDYSGILKDDEEREREADAAAIAEAVGEELAARGLAGDAPDADGDEDDDVHKSTEDEDDADDGPDREDLHSDYSGVVEKATMAAYEQRVGSPDGDTDADADGDADEDDEDGGDGDSDASASVEKAGKRTADLLADMQDDIRDLKRLRAVRNVAKFYVANGGDPHDNLAEVFEWLDDRCEEDITVENDGSVTVEEPA